MSHAIAVMEGHIQNSSIDAYKSDLSKEIITLAQKLHIRNMLQAYKMTMGYAGSLKQSKAKLLLVQMRPDEGRVQVRGFRLNESRFANEKYLEMEKEIPQESAVQAVLVRVDSVNSLKRAYQNYF